MCGGPELREREREREREGESEREAGLGTSLTSVGVAVRGQWQEARWRHWEQVWAVVAWRCQTKERGLYREGGRAPRWALRREGHDHSSV